MTTINYLYSTTPFVSNAYTATWVTGDTFNFDLDTLSASLITGISDTTGSVVMGIGGSNITFSGLASVAAITSGMFIFADGSHLIVGDNLATTLDTAGTAKNVLLATGYNDYFLGISTAASNTVSYANATSGVTVSLAITATQDTGFGVNTLNGIQNLTGSKFSDKLTGNSSANVITGGGGNDTLIGGGGNDTFYVTSGDVVQQGALSGDSSTVIAATDYSLASSTGNVQTLILSSAATAIYATGNSLADTIAGNNYNNVIDGGINTLADTFYGGGGNDTYIIRNSGDVVVAQVGAAGTVINGQTVFGNAAGLGVINDYAASYNMNANAVNVTTLYMKGSTAASVTSNSLASGTSIYGNGTAATGGDTITGGTGKMFISELGQGGANLLIAGTGTATIIGGIGNDTLVGGASGAGKFAPGTALDTLSGGLGSNVYYVNNSSDVINQAVGPATSNYTNTVYTTVNYTLNSSSALGVNNLIIHHTDTATTITATGNSAANTISVDATTGSTGTGTTANNILVGGGGQDTLKGATTANSGTNTFYDQVIGNAVNNTSTGGVSFVAGTGTNTYNVTNIKDTLTSTAATAGDYVITTVSFDLLSQELATTDKVTHLTLTGAGSYNLIGNNLGDTIVGNSGSNLIIGGTGVDTISAVLTGNKVLIGNGGGDTMTVASGNNLLCDNKYYIYVGGLPTLSTSATLNDTNINTFTVTNSEASAALIANITGTAGARQTASGSASTMTAGSGNDTFLVNNTNDTIKITATGGFDTVYSTVIYNLLTNATTYSNGATPPTTQVGPGTGFTTVVAGVQNLYLDGTAGITGTGNTLGNNISAIYSTSGSNTLIGGLGNDTLTGSTSGNDTFYDNTNISGATAATIATSLDTSANTMYAGAGNNDVFYVTNASDIVNATLTGTVTASNTANETIFSAVNFLLNDLNTTTGSATSAVKNLTLIGNGTSVGSNFTALATGNSLANVIHGSTTTGLTNTTTLVGGAGADTFYGGSGNTIFYDNVINSLVTDSSINVLHGGNGTNTYNINDQFDVIIQDTSVVQVTGTVNTINSSTSYTIGANNTGTYVGTTSGIISNFNLVGSTANITADASATSNTMTIKGNFASDTLIGGSGTTTFDDGKENGIVGTVTMIGGTGSNTFLVNNAGDTVSVAHENAGSVNTIETWVSNVTAGANINKLILEGNAFTGYANNSNGVTLVCNAGNDILKGGTGSDTFIASTGQNVFTGGGGTDSYVFTVGDSTLTTFNQVTDFVSIAQAVASGGGTSDIIDLTTLLSGPTGTAASGISAVGGLVTQAIGTGSIGAHTLEWYVSGSNEFIVANNTGTAGTADFKLELTGYNTTYALTASHTVAADIHY
jgi:Ca2+-binding RTX toxin-like protein